MEEIDGIQGMHAGASPAIFKRAKALRENMTEPEKLLWEYLRKKPLGFKFRRQHPFSTYILDFYCHKAKLSIEIDGESHNWTDQKEYDQIRTEFIRGLNIVELRFKNEQVLSHLGQIKQEIERQLRADSLQGIQGCAKEETQWSLYSENSDAKKWKAQST